ncbi:hypothetical protein Pla123a_44460 [Posidoniimonas polymericola]|uniref:DUF3352 domain-containing protein n=1 Tax=Posidoniimonas polymericola TaxID=2528002 RepID=A0A5C5XUS4_9BACT|nr:hypothetical protein [Posidoniimonas polymericola]TWT67017.1 hypothetical protein Pla123a_44460 [Posidoniimonas polymericola]
MLATPTPRPTFGFLLVAALLAPLAARQAIADHPTAMSLFPAETVLFLRTADAGLLVERFQATALAKMVNDPGMAPFVGSLQDSTREAYADNAEGLLGVSYDELASLPQGEVAFALIERVGETPALLLLADFGDQVATAEKMLEQAKEKVTEGGGLASEEQLRADKAVTLRDKNNAQRTIGVVRREGVFVAATDPAVLSSVLDRWDGFTPPAAIAEDGEEPAPAPYTDKLERNKAFATSLKECLAGREEPPQMIAFVDPIGVVRATNGQQTSVRVALAALPALGVDAFEGASAALWLANDTWEGLVRGHLLIDNPRAGVAGILRLQSGDTIPPDCVPESVLKYTTAYVNPQQIFDDIEAVVDRFTYAGMFRERVKKNFSDNVGVDLPSELLPVLTGRATTITAFEPDAQSPVNHTMVLFGVEDEAAAQELLYKAALKQHGEAGRESAKRTHGSFTYYASPDNNDNGNDENNDERGRRPRRGMRPVAAVFNGSLVIGNSEVVLHQMMAAAEGTAPRLADSLQFKLVKSRVKRLAGPNEVGMMTYENPEASLRHWFTLASKPETREWLGKRENPVGVAVHRALESGELPPVEDLLKYATPRGSLVYDSATGLHYLSFQFKPAE